MNFFESLAKALFLVSLFLLTALTPLLAADDSAEKVPVVSTGAGPQAQSEPRGYIIGPQNLLQIKIFGDATSSQMYRVDEGGFVKHALIGRVKLSGMSVEDAEKMMETRLAGDYIINPQVTIFILEYSRFSIIGEVQRPGTYEITGRVSVIEAISMAGGFTRIANPRGVKIMRNKEGQESAIEIDTTRVTQHGDRSADVAIDAGDILVVSKSFF